MTHINFSLKRNLVYIYGLINKAQAHDIRHSPSPCVCVFTTSNFIVALLQIHHSQEWLKMDSEAENSQTHMRIKTQLCRRFMQGTCPLVAPQCNYAHGYNDLRTATGPRFCRMFMHTRHCSYGHNCRFLHATPPLPLHHGHPQQQQHENFSPQPRIFLQLLSFTTLALLFGLVCSFLSIRTKRVFISAAPTHLIKSVLVSS